MFGGLLHHLGVDTEPAGGVDDDDVAGGAAGVLDRVAGHLHRVADAVAGLRGVHLDAGPATEHLELPDGVGALEVGGDQQRLVALALEPAGQLAGERRLTGTLEAGQHDHGRRVLGELEPPPLAAEDVDQLLVDDLDDLLGRVERLGDLGAARPLLDVRDEALDHRQGDVGLQQRQPDLARGGVDVGVGEPALAAELGEDPGQAVTQGVKHANIPFVVFGGHMLAGPVVQPTVRVARRPHPRSGPAVHGPAPLVGRVLTGVPSSTGGVNRGPFLTRRRARRPRCGPVPRPAASRRPGRTRPPRRRRAWRSGPPAPGRPRRRARR